MPPPGWLWPVRCPGRSPALAAFAVAVLARALLRARGPDLVLAAERLAWQVHDARGAVCVLSLRRAGRMEGSILDSCFSRKSLPAGCEFPHLDRICWPAARITELRSRQLCGWSRSRNRVRYVRLAPGHVGAWNAGTEVRRLEDISMVPSFRCETQVPNAFSSFDAHLLTMSAHGTKWRRPARMTANSGARAVAGPSPASPERLPHREHPDIA